MLEVMALISTEADIAPCVKELLSARSRSWEASAAAGTINLCKHSSVMPCSTARAAPPAEQALKAGAVGCRAGSGSLSPGAVAWK